MFTKKAHHRRVSLSSTLCPHTHVSHVHRTLGLIAIWPIAAEEVAVVNEFRSETALDLLLPEGAISPSCVTCELRGGQRVCTESEIMKKKKKTQPFTRPNKFHRDLSSRERGKGFGKGGWDGGGVGGGTMSSLECSPMSFLSVWFSVQ